jgi:hypothetical protein
MLMPLPVKELSWELSRLQLASPRASPRPRRGAGPAEVGGETEEAAARAEMKLRRRSGVAFRPGLFATSVSRAASSSGDMTSMPPVTSAKWRKRSTRWSAGTVGSPVSGSGDACGWSAKAAWRAVERWESWSGCRRARVRRLGEVADDGWLGTYVHGPCTSTMRVVGGVCVVCHVERVWTGVIRDDNRGGGQRETCCTLFGPPGATLFTGHEAGSCQALSTAIALHIYLLRAQPDFLTYVIMSTRALPPDLRASERQLQTREPSIATKIEEALHNIQDWKLGEAEEHQVEAWIEWIDKVWPLYHSY